jgi:hypothetical protein
MPQAKTALSAIMKTLLAFSYRFNRLRGLKTSFAVKVGADFRFETGIPKSLTKR